MVNVRLCAIAAYLGAIVAANWTTAHFGLLPMGFGLAATAGTFAAGFAFVARDAVQDAAGRLATICVLAGGCALSAYLATPALAVASAAAFGLSELADMVVYTPLRDKGYVRAALASNVVGAVVDTLAFLWLAGFGITAGIVAGQLVGKTWATVAVVFLVGVARALLRNRVRPEGV